MAISFSRPDPSSPAAVSAANFTMARRGFDPDEVHEFLRMVAAELARLQERERFLERELRATQYAGTPAAVAVDEDMVTKVLGEEAARILTTSREAAAQIKSRAEETAARMLREATDEAQRLREEAEIEAARRRQDSASDAESEIQMAKQQGREMVNEARAYRERVLGELARRRELARQQIEGLVHGRDRLLQAFERARVAAVDVMADLTPLTDPGEFVNLSPTTGSVPVIADTSDHTAARAAAAHTTAEAVAAADAMLAAANAVVEASTATARPTKATMAAVPSMAAPAAPDDGDGDQIRDAHDGAAPDATAHDAGASSAVAEAPSTGGDATMGIQRTPRRSNTVVLLPEPTQPTHEQASADGDADDDEGDGARAMPQRSGRQGHIAPVVSLFAADKEVPGRPQPPAPPQAPITQSRRSTPSSELHSGHPVHQAAAEPTPAPTPAPAAAAPEPARDAPRTADPATTADAAADTPGTATEAGTPASSAPRDSVDDLFARLRAARAGGVAERARAEQPTADVAASSSSPTKLAKKPEAARADAAKPDAKKPDARKDTKKADATAPTASQPSTAKAGASGSRSSTPPAVFQASARDPHDGAGAAHDLVDPTPFSRRDAELTPLIVAAARKLKRALADEQNDALLVLRRKTPVVELDALLPDGAEHLRRYEQAVRDELVQAALAGAASLDDGSAVEHQRAIDAHHALGPAMEQLAASIINPLRERLDRAVKGAAGENAAVVDAVRAVYREWKTQRIDEHLDDVVRTAFGRGAFVVLAPGAPVCWTVDPNGPDCPDAEDNTLGGVVRAGEAFPTDHVCAPAHEGCRCMLQRAPQ